VEARSFIVEAAYGPERWEMREMAGTRVRMKMRIERERERERINVVQQQV
jgi:hypothetical protein